MDLLRKIWEFLFRNVMWLYIIMGLFSWVGIYPMTFQLLMFVSFLFSVTLVPKYRMSNVLDFFVVIFIIYIFISSIVFDYPDHLYLWQNDLFFTILPMSFYFIAKTTNYQLESFVEKMAMPMQVCLYHSDVLITDNSSVWIDYLLLERPLIFYYYDKFEDEDTGVLYDIREDPPGHFCKTEDELFQLIKKTKEDYDSMRPSEHIISKYHKYVDGNSCERYFKAIVNGKD